jgi:hypothetical protein
MSCIEELIFEEEPHISVRMKACLSDPLDHVDPICMLDVVRALVRMITIYVLHYLLIALSMPCLHIVVHLYLDMSMHLYSLSLLLGAIDISYAAPQAHGIINVAHHREYPLGIVFIFSQGRKYLYHV